MVYPPGVGWAASVAQQQRSGVPVGERMLLGSFVGDCALPFEPHVTVRVHQAWHQPNRSGNGLRVGDWLGSDDPVYHPKVAIFTFRQHHASEVEAVRPFDMLRAHDLLLAEAAAQLRWQLELGHRLL